MKAWLLLVWTVSIAAFAAPDRFQVAHQLVECAGDKRQFGLRLECRGSDLVVFSPGDKIDCELVVSETSGCTERGRVLRVLQSKNSLEQWLKACSITSLVEC